MYSRNEAHFVNIPGMSIQHSGLDLSHDVITSMNVGELIPIRKPQEVLPGDTFSFGVASLCRLTTLLTPIMDDLFMDIYHFFVPFRLVWEHYKNFEGQNDTAPWVPTATYSIPQIKSPTGGWSSQTIADYFGLPINVGNIVVSALPFRAYSLIVKDWFYDENNQTPPNFLKNDATITGSNGGNYVTDLIKGGKPFIAGKTHDIFTSCLPSPQKGDSVLLPLGNVSFASSTIPVGTTNIVQDINNGHFERPLHGVYTTGSDHTVDQSADGLSLYLSGGHDSTGNRAFGAGGVSVFDVQHYIYPTNLAGYLDGISTDISSSTTINDLRLAFQTQRLLELMARGGTRYYEILCSQWGISAPAGLIERSEYLGGHRFNIRVNSVVQTSSTDTTSPQGNLTGMSVSTNFKHDFKKAFSERGYIISLGVVRYNHSYSQGIDKLWKRKDKYDFYNNAFAHIGEQPIFNYQIYAQGTNVDDEVFGYNEAFVDYRYNENMITGQMRPTASGSLDVWHLGDYFTSLPTLSSDFIKEEKSNVDRVIAVSSSLSNQVLASFHFEISAIRPMPLYSIPGLIDHL